MIPIHIQTFPRFIEILSSMPNPEVFAWRIGDGLRISARDRNGVVDHIYTAEENGADELSKIRQFVDLHKITYRETHL